MTVTADSSFRIGPAIVGNGRCFIVAEVAQAHDGSLGTAHAFIDAVADVGADAVKFQTHLAHAESTPGEPFRVHFSKQDNSRYDYWKRMEFTSAQWSGLAEHATDCGILFLSSPFSFEAVELLDGIGVPAWKVGSGETTNSPFLDCLARTGKPILLSSGMSTWEELDAAVERIQRSCPVAVLQCTTSYPCPLELVGLNVVSEMRKRYTCPIGLSDHSGTPYPSYAAASMGCDVLELHVTFSKRAFGPDVRASLTIEELGEVVRAVRAIETMRSHPVQKNELAHDFEELRTMFGKSIVAARSVPSGTVLSRDDLALKKPGTGIAAARLEDVIGRTVIRELDANDFLSESDLE